MNVGLLFVLGMAFGIGFGTYGVYNFEKKWYSVLSYFLGIMTVLPLVLIAFPEDLIAFVLVLMLFGSMIYFWTWVCYGCSMMFYGSVVRKRDSEDLNFNTGRLRA